MPRVDGINFFGSNGNSGGFGAGRGRNKGNRPGSGPMGNCICPSCGHKVVHKQGIPCISEKCPQCGANMIKE